MLSGELDHISKRTCTDTMHIIVIGEACNKSSRVVKYRLDPLDGGSNLSKSVGPFERPHELRP